MAELIRRSKELARGLQRKRLGYQTMQDFIEGMEPPLFARADEGGQHLRIDRSELKRGLKILARTVKPEQAGDALLSFEEGHAVFDLSGVSVRVPATGYWASAVCFSGEYLLVVAKSVPIRDPVEIYCKGDRIHIGTSSTRYASPSQSANKIEMRLAPEDGWLLSVALRHGEEAVNEARIGLLVENARARKAVQVDKATRALQKYGVSSKDVEALVDRTVQRNWAD